MRFYEWWAAHKTEVCSDICRELKLDFNDPLVALKLEHIAFQAWLGHILNGGGDNAASSTQRD